MLMLLDSLSDVKLRVNTKCYTCMMRCFAVLNCRRKYVDRWREWDKNEIEWANDPIQRECLSESDDEHRKKSVYIYTHILYSPYCLTYTPHLSAVIHASIFTSIVVIQWASTFFQLGHFIDVFTLFGGYCVNIAFVLFDESESVRERESIILGKKKRQLKWESKASR